MWKSATTPTAGWPRPRPAKGEASVSARMIWKSAAKLAGAGHRHYRAYPQRGPGVRVELRRQGSNELIDAALTRDDYQQLRLALGDTVYVRPRKLAVFLDEGANI